MNSSERHGRHKVLNMLKTLTEWSPRYVITRRWQKEGTRIGAGTDWTHSGRSMNAMRFACQSVQCFCLSRASLLTPLDDQQCTLNIHRGERSAFIRRSCRLLSLHGDASTSLLPRLSEAVTVVPAQIALYYIYWASTLNVLIVQASGLSHNVTQEIQEGSQEGKSRSTWSWRSCRGPVCCCRRTLHLPAAVPATVDCIPQIAAFLGVSARAGPTRCVAFFAFVCQSQAFF